MRSLALLLTSCIAFAGEPVDESAASEPAAKPWERYPPPPGYKVVPPPKVPKVPQPQCPTGHYQPYGATKCLPIPKPIVERSWLGRCPAGYIDHPSEPRLCATPLAAKRLLGRHRRDR